MIAPFFFNGVETIVAAVELRLAVRDLDDADNLRAKESAMLGLPFKSIFADEVQVGDRKIDGKQLKWSVFHDFDAGRMYSVMQEWVFPFIKNLHGDKNSAYSRYMDDAIFKIPTPLLLSKVVDALDGIFDLMEKTQKTDADISGDVYEYLLSKIASSGLNGQFRTPRHIIKMMVEMMQPKADDVICDPACGTSGFLVAASEYLKENRKEENKYIKKAGVFTPALLLFSLACQCSELFHKNVNNTKKKSDKILKNCCFFFLFNSPKGNKIFSVILHKLRIFGICIDIKIVIDNCVDKLIINLWLF